MNSLKLTLGAGLASIALGSQALADDAKPTWAVNAAVTSNYVFRGVSQVGGYDPAVQGGLDLTYGPAYLGTWASNVKFGDGTDAEIDVYGGVKPAVSGFSFDFGVIGYLYPGAPKSDNVPYVEFKGAVSHALGPATIGAAVYYSPDFTFTPGVTAAGVYYEGNVSAPLSKRISLSGAVGHQHVDKGFLSYTTWNAGVTWNFLPHLALDGRYWDTDAHSVGKPYHSRVVASLKATFP